MFSGKRYGLEVIPSSDGATKIAQKNLPDEEFLDYSFLRTPNFISYQDWEAIVYDGVNGDLNLSDFATTKIHRSSFYNPGFYPKGTFFNEIYKPSNFNLNWEVFAFDK